MYVLTPAIAIANAVERFTLLIFVLYFYVVVFCSFWYWGYMGDNDCKVRLTDDIICYLYACTRVCMV